MICFLLACKTSEGRVRKVLEDVIKTESQKIFLAQHSIEGGRGTRSGGKISDKGFAEK